MLLLVGNMNERTLEGRFQRDFPWKVKEFIMANAFSFKEVTTRTMKIAGMLDTDRMVMDVDGEEKSLATLLSAFNGVDIELVAKVKAESELDEPTED